jgi:hypothetical protein
MWICRTQMARNRNTGFPVLGKDTRIINPNVVLIGVSIVSTIAILWRGSKWLRK